MIYGHVPVDTSKELSFYKNSYMIMVEKLISHMDAYDIR